MLPEMLSIHANIIIQDISTPMNNKRLDFFFRIFNICIPIWGVFTRQINNEINEIPKQETYMREINHVLLESYVIQCIALYNTLKTIQNSALRIVTGSKQTTPTNHLHYETQVLTLQDRINMWGTQFLAAASANPDHPCHYMLAHQPTPRRIKTTPQALYTGLVLRIGRICYVFINK